jgi:hypothetical protein
MTEVELIKLTVAVLGNSPVAAGMVASAMILKSVITRWLDLRDRELEKEPRENKEGIITGLKGVTKQIAEAVDTTKAGASTLLDQGLLRGGHIILC